MKAVFLVLLMVFSLNLSGCTLSSNIDTSQDMTPRLISVSDDLQISEMVEEVKAPL